MDCHNVNDIADDKKIAELDNKILLIGNPNVGKSVIFTALTGVHVMSANYAGTTVSYTKAKMTLDGTEYNVIDVPGIYSLDITSEAELVAVKFAQSQSKAVVCVLDATNLTRNLNLALEIMNFGMPVVFALNLVDVAERKGISISAEILEKELGAAVIKTVAVKGEGIEELRNALKIALEQKTAIANVEITEPINDEATEQSINTDAKEVHDCSKCSKCKPDNKSSKTQSEIWQRSREIAKKCTTQSEANLSKLDILGQKLTQPMPGIPMAIAIMIISLGLVVGLGKALRAVVFIPIISGMVVPFFQNLIGSFNLPEMLNNILIGEYGLFVIGFEWPLSLILPYVTIFYLVFTFLEDCGIMPRMAILFDGVMRKMGIQGGSLITLMLGYGCAVPAIIGTRVANTRKERLIVTSMVCFAVPCISQTAALVALLGDYSLWLILAIFGLSFVILFVVGFIMSKFIQGDVEPIIIEVPSLLMPEKKTYGKKILVRMKSFLIEAEGPMLVAVAIVALVKETGLLDVIANVLEPLLSGLLGLPKEAALSLIVGVFRREMAVAPLLTMDLSPLQMFVGATVCLLYLPCLSVFGIIAKEFNSKVAVAIGISTFTVAIGLGAVINLLGQFII